MFFSRLHWGVVPAHLVRLLAVHSTHRCVAVLQAGVGPSQSPSLVQPVQTLVVVLQVGVAPTQALPLVPVHCTQRCVAVLQAGVEPPQSLSLAQPVQVLLARLQVGVAPTQALVFPARHCTHAPEPRSQTGVEPLHCPSLVQGKPHQPVAREHEGAPAGQGRVAPEPLLPLQLMHDPLFGPEVRHTAALVVEHAAAPPLP